jgi:hypothetical protein
MQKANLFITKVLRAISCQEMEELYTDSQFIKLFSLQKEYSMSVIDYTEEVRINIPFLYWYILDVLEECIGSESWGVTGNILQTGIDTRWFSTMPYVT